MDIKFYGAFVLNRRVAPDTLVDFHTGTRMPKDRVCKRLKQSNGEICNVKYQVQVDNNLSDEEMLAQLKKKRVKELKGILNDRGVKCEGCLEKDDFIKKIMATNGMSTDF